jgi:hypothetical protein
VKKIIEENEFLKKLAKDKDQQIAKLANEHELAKLVIEKEEENKKLKNEMEEILKNQKSTSKKAGFFGFFKK